jgi:hypothetical protein
MRYGAAYGGGHGYGSPEGGIASALTVAGLLVVVVLVLGVWAIIKSVDLVLRAWRQCQGKSQTLRIALFTWCGLVVLVPLCGVGVGSRLLPSGIGSWVFIALCGILTCATGALLITARAVELKYRLTFASEPSTLIHQVLRKPWWTSAGHQAP